VSPETGPGIFFYASFQVRPPLFHSCRICRQKSVFPRTSSYRIRLIGPFFTLEQESVSCGHLRTFLFHAVDFLSSLSVFFRCFLEFREWYPPHCSDPTRFLFWPIVFPSRPAFCPCWLPRGKPALVPSCIAYSLSFCC